MWQNGYSAKRAYQNRKEIIALAQRKESNGIVCQPKKVKSQKVFPYFAIETANGRRNSKTDYRQMTGLHSEPSEK
jgi:hypothetical protein